jgi:multidrug efflux pump subunit AcrA (membrane-fusion protein)
MNKSLLIAALLTIGLVGISRAQQPAAQTTNPEIKSVVRVADSIKLPAKEPGVLVHLGVKEGSIVRRGQEIGKIDDTEPRMKKIAAGADYAGAYKRWKEDIEIRYAKAQADVAKAEYDQLVETNRMAAKAVAEVDIRKAKLEWEHFKLAIEKSYHDQELAKFEAFTKQAELDAAELAIQRRTIVAPFDGVIEELKKKQDEWVQPGDTILTLLRLDTMNVEGAIAQGQYDQHEVQGCDVSVTVKLARGREVTARGKIVKVSNIVQYRGANSPGVYNVRAEVPNTQEHGTWVLRDGLPATMTVQLGTGQNATAKK